MATLSKRKTEVYVSPARRAAIEQYVERSVPPKHQILTRRALLGQLTKSAAIKVACLQCCNYARDEVINCAVITCALHAVRPYQTDEAADGEES